VPSRQRLPPAVRFPIVTDAQQPKSRRRIGVLTSSESKAVQQRIGSAFYTGKLGAEDDIATPFVGRWRVIGGFKAID